MTQFLKLLRRLDFIRMAFGICMVVDGYPLIFFIKETLKLAPGSTVFTALFMLLGFILMVPFSLFRRLYKPNYTLFWLCITFLLITTLYMFYYTNVGYDGVVSDLLYYAYILIFLFLLINIPNDILEDIVPVIVLFSFISSMALIYALVKDPFWAVGQRAYISYDTGISDEKGGNPHVFAKNSIFGIVASLVWAFRSKTNILVRIFCLLNTAIALAILVLTQTRSSTVAVILMAVAFIVFNARPDRIRSMGRALTRPATLITIAALFFVVSFIFQRYSSIYGILYGYVVGFAERNLENVYALLGMKVNNQTVVLDDSAANRGTSTVFLMNVIVGHLHTLLLGSGYKFMYLDIPLVESLINHGFVGLFLFGGFNLVAAYYAFGAMRTNPHPFSTFLGYFYLYLFVLMFTNGRPYDIYLWHPYALLIRFLGVEKFLPARLLSPNV